MFFPLTAWVFDPDAAFLSGNSAQIMRMFHAALCHEGGRIRYSTDGHLACADLIVTPIQNPGCHGVLPGHGSRRLAHTNDDGMGCTFTYTPKRGEEIGEGLAQTHEVGLRTPLHIYLDYEVVFPQQYEKRFTLGEEKKT